MEFVQQHLICVSSKNSACRRHRDYMILLIVIFLIVFYFHFLFHLLFKFHCHSSLEKILACICSHPPIIISLFTYRGRRGRELKRELNTRELTTRRLGEARWVFDCPQAMQCTGTSNSLLVLLIHF